MILVPKGEIIVDELKSYYVDIAKLCEYYQGHTGSFGVFFDSAGLEGALFFDQSAYLGGGMRKKGESMFNTDDPVESFSQKAAETDFTISVYKVDTESVYYWASLFNTRTLYEELKSDFTDLGGLIKKMESEGLTGYIHIDFEDRPGGTIFFRNGEIVHVACLVDAHLPDLPEGENRNIARLLNAADKYDGRFNVREIPLSNHLTVEPDVTPVVSAGNDVDAAGAPAFEQERALRILGELLNIFESAFNRKFKQRQDFSVVLKKKFVEKAGKFDFLDPFAGEFAYADAAVTYQGNADWKTLVNGVLEAVFELADDLKMTSLLEKQLANWRSEYKTELTELGYGA